MCKFTVLITNPTFFFSEIAKAQNPLNTGSNIFTYMCSSTYIFEYNFYCNALL